MTGVMLLQYRSDIGRYIRWNRMLCIWPLNCRTQMFYYSYSCFISTELIGPPLAAWMSSYSNWIPVAMALALQLLCFPIVKVMPEPQDEGGSALSSGTESDSELSSPVPLNDKKSIWRHAWDSWRKVSIMSFFKKRNMALAFPIFFVGILRGVSIRVLLQYSSVRFSWRLSQVGVEILHVDRSKPFNWGNRPMP